MKNLIIFFMIILSLASFSFAEAYVEGRNAWDKKKLGWKFKIGRFTFTGYHFHIFYITFPLLLLTPLILNFSKVLLGTIISAYALGLVIEDFLWFVVNPAVKFSELNPKFADYYPWTKIGKLQIPTFYIIGILISILSWFFLIR